MNLGSSADDQRSNWSATLAYIPPQFG